MLDFHPLIEAALPTALGTFTLTPIRERSIHVATGPEQTVTVHGAALTVNAQLSPDDDGLWQLTALSAEPPDADGASAHTDAARWHAALQDALVPAVQAWADANPHALWYAEYLHARDQQLRRLRQLRDQLGSVEDTVHALLAARQLLASTEALLARHLGPPPTAPPGSHSPGMARAERKANQSAEDEGH